MEYCGGGSVSDIMVSANMTLAEDLIAVVSAAVLKGLVYLHKNKNIHRVRDLNRTNHCLAS